MTILTTPIIIGSSVAAVFVLWLFVALCFRSVVSTNEVHIAQSAKKTTSYGKGEAAGNVYYAWPAWLPRIGIKVIRIPVSVFNIGLKDYAAYDKGRVPFVIDVMAFFRIADSGMAAQRVHDTTELNQQLVNILQGSTRTILASHEIEEILEGRSKFGEAFTKEVDGQLKEWGVGTVKMIELMDIRDAHESEVIQNIMAKKKSLIEMQSRSEVAGNLKTAQMAEIDAERAVEVSKQEALQTIGVRTAEQEQQVGIAKEQAQQNIKEQARVTAEKDMAVKQVQNVRAAQIERDVQVVAAEQDKQTKIIKAEGEKQQTVTIAQGTLEQAKLNAQGIEVEGKAKGEAEKAVLLAPVSAQITLAKEIGANDGYQRYLVSVKQIDAAQIVGVEQARALQSADVKVISNAGTPTEGVTNVMELLSSKGGTQVGAMLEALKQTPIGAELLGKVASLGKGNGSGSAA